MPTIVRLTGGDHVKNTPTKLSPELLNVLLLTRQTIHPDPSHEKFVADLTQLVNWGLVKRSKITPDVRRLWPYLADRPFAYKWTEAGEELYNRQKRERNKVVPRTARKPRV